jgi:FHS family glucose/mannose:H+ symporter-like MFS transporter
VTDGAAASAPLSRTLTPIAHAAILIFGVVMALVGAVVPVVSQRMALDLGTIGTLFLAMNGAMLAASLTLGLVVDRVGLRPPLASGAGLVGAGLLLVAAATSPSLLLIGVAALGAGGGALNGAANILVADLHVGPAEKAAALNRLGVYFGIGALLVPFTVGTVMATLGLAGVLAGAAVLCAALGAVALAATFPAARQRHGWPLARVGTYARQPVVVGLALLLFFQSGNEFLLGGYVSSLLTRELGVSIPGASLWLAGFWGAIMASRIGMGRLLRHVRGSSVVTIGAAGAALACLLLATAPTGLVAGIAALLAGLSLAPIFPTVLGEAGARFPEQTGAVFGLLFTVALTGGMTMPWVAGHLASAAGLPAVFVLATGNFVMVAACMQYVRTRRSSPPDPSESAH